ncbi:DUF4861 domain-containing protein [Aggregatimonas sangjinii]|uniref:DUF4861 domain-containing protein n=1 Tax=Aggregatimonas sangjinii TaxID=2583587 RepID=A0A5B7SXX5_9FLAO|nr:DUF4861 domain-containing protein [Aggregatimonas sangjinii]QCX01948.1 DUF4861 domain-containing protein [Aggregatimonas sangjinii]
MRNFNLISILAATILVVSCGEKEKPNPQIVVKNDMAINRSLETVSVPIASLGLENPDGNLLIKDIADGTELVSQLIDTDADGNMDAILFQPEIAANAEKTYEIVPTDKKMDSEDTPACYSRFVPERTDDYAWENNRVAFRTYGPTAQKMKEDGVKGGTLSSGMDAWLKRVDYPIIDKWYHKELETDGSYHEDNGEGLDNFHVGISRGVGGIAKKVDSTYYISKNFTSWKTLHNGPLQTSFELTYADWDAAGDTISEKKRITLDYGSNLSKFEVMLTGTDTISAGLTLHDKKGTKDIHQEDGWISYWEPHEDSELGTAIVVPGMAMAGFEYYDTDKTDESNFYAHIATLNDKATYYAGFGWKKSGQFENKAEWNDYLTRFADCLKNPLVVEIK